MNKVFLIGNLTQEPELTETSSGVKICRFSIAVNRNYAGAEGERKTDFFNCIAWRTLGENISKYAKKGHKIAVVGSIEQRQYEDRNGNKRTDYDVIVQDCEFLTPKQKEENAYHSDTATQQSNKNVKRKTIIQSFDDDSDIHF